MSDAFAALPGSMIIRLDPETSQGFEATPIIGWLTTKGTRVAPLTAQVAVPVQHGIAYVIPGDELMPVMVNDPVYRLTFSGVPEWLAFIEKQNPDEAPAPRSPVQAANLPWVVFDHSKTFVKTSYWHYKDGEDEFVFEVPGGEQLPDDSRVVRSNRKDFLVLKKSCPAVKLADLVDREQPEVDLDAPQDEPEVELDEEAEDLV